MYITAADELLTVRLSINDNGSQHPIQRGHYGVGWAWTSQICKQRKAVQHDS